jgi:hypothetical protein
MGYFVSGQVVRGIGTRKGYFVVEGYTTSGLVRLRCYHAESMRTALPEEDLTSTTYDHVTV